MEIEEEDETTVPQVFYEARHHASRPYSSNYPPLHPQLNEGTRGTFRSLLSLRGLSEFKETFLEKRHPQKIRRWTSMFVSPSGQHVAVAVGNQITFLQKNDDYQEPCGILTSSSLVTFMFGAWSEDHDILGVFDDMYTLYFIRANGEEITRIKRQHLKVPLPIIGFVIHDDEDMKKSCLCTFSILATDGSLHDIEIGRDPSASISTMCSSSIDSSIQKQFPQNVFCCGYHPDSSLLAVVSSVSSITSTSNVTSGLYSISLWRLYRQSGLQLVASAQFEGLFIKTNGYADQVTSPKVLFSPQGEFVAALDLRGCLCIYELDEENSLSVVYSKQNDLSNVVDFTWWSDRILVIASRTGDVNMLDIPSGVKVLENDCRYSLPILEGVTQLPGHIYLLESRSSEKNFESSDLLLFEPITVEKYKQLSSAKFQWGLISFSERSVPELYDILINRQQFQAAMDLADRHGLDKDEALKAQWLLSLQGTSEINLLLSHIKDQSFVLTECVDRVGPTEDAVRALIAYGLHLTNRHLFSEVDDDECSPSWDFRLARLKLLQYRDRLETFLGINMGRFSVQDYSKFRLLPINEAAIALAESGKIGALNLLFKRQSYSIPPFMLEVLAAIPETVPVQTYGQLLPGSSAPPVTALREEDWVECERMVNYIKRLPENHESGVQIRTEPIVKQLLEYSWPSSNELSAWYKQRARDMDTLSGQLDNCLSLVDFACRKGIKELQQFLELIFYLHQLIYSADDDHDMNFTMSLTTWEQLSDYEKFKLMLKGFNEENVIKKLRDKAVPFMQKSLGIADNNVDSFMVRWMKEVAMQNKIEICLIIIEEGCKEFGESSFFRNEAEAVDCALQCLYLLTTTDKWSTMASMLSKFPHLHGNEVEGLKKRLKLAEGHVEAGRLLTLYQVPKPITYFLEAQSDSKNVKQILRLILSKFIRRQPGRTDNDWANMWRDFQTLQEKAFPFVDLEYMLMEFCRGLLKAGKFSLARNYLKGSGSLVLATEKAENLVIQAAREYFFSASSLSCSEIWKAKECLNIFPSSRNAMVEADIIDALTVKLPRLGVNILPLQFRQIKDPMEIIKLAITSQGGAYLNVDELIEIAKLLGLNSQDEISAVQEAIAREAAVAGDLQLAFDLCLVMAKKGHGPVWDLCAALARGPALDNMDFSSRKQLLGFALSHCDKDSIAELLHAWKDLDMLSQCERLSILTGKDVPELSGHGSSIFSDPHHGSHDIVDLIDSSGKVNENLYDEQKVYFSTVKKTLSDVANVLSAENASDFDSILRENGKVLAFVALRLPWLLELSREGENGQQIVSGSVSRRLYTSVRTQAMATVLSWLARNDFCPKDNVIASLAKLIIEPPVTEEEDILGCSFLLNLNDAFYGVQIIEEQVKSREDYDEICSMMNVGMIYSLLHNSGAECEGAAQRRELLLRKFREKYTSLSSDERNKIDQAQSSFWREWKSKLEEQKRVADHTRAIEQVIPGVETERFLSGDINYMESVVFSFVESVKTEKKRILKDVLKLASDYGLSQTKVLLKFLGSALVSDVWTIDEIKFEISEFESKILDCAEELIETISLSIYPAIDGRNKQRLAYIYELLSNCYTRVQGKNELSPIIGIDPAHLTIHGLDEFYKIMEQECNKISFIEDLNFKNIAGLHGLNLKCITSEVYAHVNEKNVEALAEMMKTFAGIFKDQVPQGLVPWQYVYGYYVSDSLKTLENNAKLETHFQTPETLRCFINELELTYEKCRNYIKLIAYPGASVTGITKKFFKIFPSLNDSFESLSADSNWKDGLVMLITFWLRLIKDLQKFVSTNDLEENFAPNCVMICLEALVNLVKDGKVSTSEGWATVFTYVDFGLVGDAYVEIFNFCRSMVVSGCRFRAIAEVFSAAISQFLPSATLTGKSQTHYDKVMDLPHLYLNILETILRDIASGSLEHQNLHCFLSSLSKLDGDQEDLRNVRSTVWERLVKFSDNMEIPNHVRVQMLELMQLITATGGKSTLTSCEVKVNVLAWEGWNNMRITCSNTEANANSATDASNRFTHTLVALKSSQLLSTVSPSLEITPNDLLTVDSAVSCFLNLCNSAISQSQIDALIAVLGEWEGLFSNNSVKDDAKTSAETSEDAGNDWGNDDWDEGWESFQEEEPVEKETTNDNNTPPVHPLHVCWAEIFKKLATLSQFKNILKLIDQSAPKRNIMLNEDEARNLNQSLLEVDCFITLKIILLLPYEEIQLECLAIVEDKLKQGNIPNSILTDHELFISLLSSTLLSTIFTKPSFGTTFSYLSYMVGSFSRQCQESELSRLKNGDEEGKKDIYFIFKSILFPCYLSELVKADQVTLAGLLVTKFMHMNSSLGLINVAEASLRKYLEKHLDVLRGNKFDFEEMSFCEGLVNTVSGLRRRLEEMIKSALLLLQHK